MIPESVKEYGNVHRIEKYSKRGCDLLIQENYYYFCEVTEERREQTLDPYEKEEDFNFEYADPEHIINVNRNGNHGPVNQKMLEREALVIELLKEEGYL